MRTHTITLTRTMRISQVRLRALDALQVSVSALADVDGKAINGCVVCCCARAHAMTVCARSVDSTSASQRAPRRQRTAGGARVRHHTDDDEMDNDDDDDDDDDDAVETVPPDVRHERAVRTRRLCSAQCVCMRTQHDHTHTRAHRRSARRCGSFACQSRARLLCAGR
jgi:hypothetical protein